MTILFSIQKPLFLLFAGHFVAGEIIEDAIKRAKKLKQEGIHSLINVLGEHIQDHHSAIIYWLEYSKLLDLIKKEGLENWVGISIKPSQFFQEHCQYAENILESYLGSLLAKAEYRGIWVEIDRENPESLGSIEKVCLKLRQKYSNFRLCVQANQERSQAEIGRLNQAKIPVRLCLGAYPGDISGIQSETRYFELAKILKENGTESAYAGHNLERVNALLRLFEGRRQNLELQFLLGIENQYAKTFVGEVGKITFYIPCGKEWLAYGKRRWQSIFKIFWRNFWQRYEHFWQEEFERGLIYPRI